eukprot:668155-Amphidinium_carterae.1
MVTQIEAERWPHQLLEVRLAPLPKGDGEGVIPSSKVRLVSVSSHVYRSWSSPPEIYGGVKGRSTFDVVAIATSMWSQAVHNEEALGQLMGLPSSVRFPFEAFVVHHKRVLALRNWAGPEINPVRGLPQGDSLS